MVAGRIANRLDLGGTNCVCDAACASTFSALAMAVNELHLGTSDVVITGGVNVDLAAAQRAADGVLGVPEVGGIVLVGVSDPDWGTRIVAVTTSALTASEIRSRLGAALGRAALPHEVRRVDSLPRTGGGKIDRQGIIGDWR